MASSEHQNTREEAEASDHFLLSVQISKNLPAQHRPLLAVAVCHLIGFVDDLVSICSSAPSQWHKYLNTRDRLRTRKQNLHTPGSDRTGSDAMIVKIPPRTTMNIKPMRYLFHNRLSEGVCVCVSVGLDM